MKNYIRIREQFGVRNWMDGCGHPRQKRKTHLVLDVDEFLSVRDDLDVRVRDGVLRGLSGRPARAAAAQLDMYPLVLLLAALLRRSLALLAPDTSKVLAEVTVQATKHLAGLFPSLTNQSWAGSSMLYGMLKLLVLGGKVVGVVLLAPDVVPVRCQFSCEFLI